jgi:hypothetical protein
VPLSFHEEWMAVKRGAGGKLVMISTPMYPERLDTWRIPQPPPARVMK